MRPRARHASDDPCEQGARGRLYGGPREAFTTSRTRRICGAKNSATTPNVAESVQTRPYGATMRSHRTEVSHYATSDLSDTLLVTRRLIAHATARHRPQSLFKATQFQPLAGGSSYHDRNTPQRIH